MNNLQNVVQLLVPKVRTCDMLPHAFSCAARVSHYRTRIHAPHAYLFIVGPELGNISRIGGPGILLSDDVIVTSAMCVHTRVQEMLAYRACPGLWAPRLEEGKEGSLKSEGWLSTT